MALRAAAEDIPAQPQGDGEIVRRMVGILNECRIIRAGLRNKKILGKIPAFVARG